MLFRKFKLIHGHTPLTYTLSTYVPFTYVILCITTFNTALNATNLSISSSTATTNISDHNSVSHSSIGGSDNSSKSIPKNTYDQLLTRLDKNMATTVRKINDFFKNMRTLQTNFVQFSEIDSKLSEGVLYIARPRKIRCEYTNPVKILLLSSGGNVVYYDRDLDEISTFSWSKIPLSFLMESGKGLETLDLTDLKLEKVDGWLLKIKASIDGIGYAMEYHFDESITKILGATIDYGGGQQIDLSFSNMQINEPIAEEVFKFKNPRLYERRNNRI